MTTTTPIPTSIAAACAAHDRHRLDVLDALLDEVAPSAVRELLGAALDLCATLRTERDEREEAIGATFAKHRAEIDAATAQLAAARQVIDEERATVARQTARVASLESERTEWIAAAVDVGAALGGSLGPVAGTSGTIDPREWIRYAQGLARDVRKLTARVAELETRPVPVPAQDRAEELIRSILSERKAMMSGIGASLDDKLSDTWASEWINATRAALASLGAPATTPTAAIDRSLALTAASLLRDIVRNGGLAEGGEIGPRASDYLDMMRRLETTPTAAPGLVAAVSVEELAKVYSKAYDEIGDRIRAIGAVLARLDATTIAPVDPEAVARAYHDHKAAPVPVWRRAADHDINSPIEVDHELARLRAVDAMRATLTAAGIPVTPEGGK